MVRRTIATVVSSTTPPPLSAKDENARQMASVAAQTANGAQQAAQQAESAAAAAAAAAESVRQSTSSMLGSTQETAAQAASTAASAAAAAQDAANAANLAATKASNAIDHANQVRADLETQLTQMTTQVQQMASQPAPTNGVNGTNGNDGKSVEMRASASAIQWRREGGTWSDLIAFTALKGSDGAPGTANLQLRLTSISVTAILLGSNVDIPVTWSSPMLDADYQIHLAPQAGLLGRSTIVVKSKTKEGCVVNVASTSLAISTGSVLTLLALDF